MTTPAFKFSILTVAMAVALSTQVWAQTLPDAGGLLREQPKVQAPQRTLEETVKEGEAEKREVAGPKVKVTAFRFKGNHLVSDAELQSLVSAYVGKEVPLITLQFIGASVSAYYKQHGYVARVILEPQTADDGVVTYTIIEGKVGKTSVNTQGSTIDTERLKKFVDYRLHRGDPLYLPTVDETERVLNDLSGLQARSLLTRGTGEGEVDIVTDVMATPRYTFDGKLNNGGTRATGRYQATGTLKLNNATGRFDSASLLLNASEGVRYGYAAYLAPIGYSGLQAGINGSLLSYEVVDTSLTATNAYGSAKSIGVNASYPLSRKKTLDLTVTGSFDEKRLKDHANGAVTNDRNVQVTKLGIDGSTLVGRDTVSFGAGLSFGNSDQQDASALAADQATRRVNGNFSKLSYQAGYTHDFGGDVEFSVALRGQLAGDNLDSTERMSLGGPDGVRAYPVGEATGDDAWLLNANLSKQLGAKTIARAFFDAGGIRQNHDLWAGWNAGNPNLPNSYHIAGVGVGIDQQIGRNTVLTVNLANPVGGNPGRDVNGHNVDGKKDGARIWLSLNGKF